jgi:hypothetical protein
MQQVPGEATWPSSWFGTPYLGPARVIADLQALLETAKTYDKRVKSGHNENSGLRLQV